MAHDDIMILHSRVAISKSEIWILQAALKPIFTQAPPIST